MKTLLLFLALTAPMLAQDTTLRIELPPVDTTKVRVFTSAEAARLYVDSIARAAGSKYRCKVNLITPAGRFVRSYDELRTSGPITRDSVLTTGCPVCGSVETVNHGAHTHGRGTVWRDFGAYLHVGCRCYDYDRKQWGYNTLDVSICASCGTVYHGRRK